MDIYNKQPLDEYLTHHGIKGQKWGVRNGPPYPLGAEDHSASEKKAGWQKSLDMGKKKPDNKKQGKDEEKGLTDKQKRAIKIGAGIAVGLLAVYGTYKLADSGELHRLAEKGKAFVNGSPPTWKKNPNLADSNMSVNEIYVKVVNGINPGGTNRFGGSRNCRRCTFAYEIARRGFDVQATSALTGTGQTSIGMYNATHDTPVKGGLIRQLMRMSKDEEVFNYVRRAAENNNLTGTKIDVGRSTCAKDIFEALSKNPNGSRGELCISFSGRSSGHSMAWEIVQGKPVIFDCQRHFVFESVEEFPSWIANHIMAATFQRLDNVDLNYDFLLKWVENR